MCRLAPESPGLARLAFLTQIAEMRGSSKDELMRQAYYAGKGGPDVIKLREVPVPEPHEHGVRVRIAAAALNRADLLQRQGHYPAPPDWPADVPGLEFAGEVEATGPGVTRWQEGDRVMGLVGGGAMADGIVAHEAELLPVPDSMSLEDAAAVPEAFLTAFDALRIRARLQSGERLLIHAVGSGVGTAAVQLAKLAGAIVIGTSRTADKLERATRLGMDLGIDTATHPFRDAMREPADVILDVLGGPALADNLSVLAPRGRLILVGFLQGGSTDVSLEPILRKRLEIIGTVMRSRSHSERAELVRAFADAVLPALWDGRLAPVVDSTFPLAELARAQKRMASNETFGKIVIEMGRTG
jgi:putative PIG3 family NAD(P)H quinone oxidoreductase